MRNPKMVLTTKGGTQGSAGTVVVPTGLKGHSGK